MRPLVVYIKKQLADLGDPEKADQMQAYMKTEQPFFGVQAKPRRKIARQAIKKFPITSREEYESVIQDLWEDEYRESNYQALEVAELKEFHAIESFGLYDKLVKSAPHWDTLDWLAGKIVSPLVLKHRELEDNLREWNTDENFWVRRASLLSHLHHKEELNSELLAEFILRLAHEQEFFIRKAIGWILRDYSYVNPEWVSDFVKNHETKLSGLSKREALKKIQKER